MSTERYRAPAEPEEDAYEDAWYRALKAKASNRFADTAATKDDKADAAPPPPASDERGNGSGGS